MSRYHINPETGEPGPCRARKSCPFGDLEADHYSSVAAARAGYEAAMCNNVPVHSKGSSTVTLSDLESMDEESQRRTMGAVWRVLTSSIWDEERRDYWQAVYDSTPHGALWLKRKGEERYASSPNSEYNIRTRKLDQYHEGNKPLALGLPEDPGHVFAKEFSGPDPMAFDKSSEEQKVKLSLISAAWLNSLTPEEAEAVSWITSNGASVINTHISGKEHSMWGHDVYSVEHIENSIAAFKRAMAKAPELEEPMIIYRGTSMANSEWTELDRPASSTTSGRRAKSFMGNNDFEAHEESEEVLLEIKTRKVPSVCGMGVHGVAELEVLAPLGRYRKVGDFHTLRGEKGERWSDMKEIEPDVDTVRVIQLEYLGP